ncbi:MAG: phosphatase PAP2 family protein [Microscillaceae bacterium]|jgi:membrane-associated phospholipid phosphatase|nr:phosphatase PAP2 family protein [Microscillaceae bacterium]
MFQTDIHIFFQSLASDWLTEFFRWMTRLGYTTFLLTFIVFVLFALDFRRGFLLLQILLVTAIITAFFKNLFAYPRPFHIDPRVRFLDTDLGGQEFRLSQTMDAGHFWGLLPPEALAQIRTHTDISYGIPSGHTSVAMALWGATALLFRRWWLSMVCIFLIVFVPLSRIYLGVHFLADVLAGYLLGLLILGIAYRYIKVLQNTQPILVYFSPLHLIYWLGVPLLGFGLLPYHEWRIPAYLLGMNLGYILLLIQGLPREKPKLWQRFARFCGALLIFGLAEYLSGFVFKSLGFVPENVVMKAFFTVVSSILFIWGGVKFNMLWGLYQKN